MNEEDFITSDLEEFKIGERIFKLKYLKGKQSDEVLDQSLTIEGKNINISVSQRNELWIKQCIIEAPYELNGIPFKDLKPEERLGIIQKLKPIIRGPLMKKIQEMNEGTEEEKKSLNQQS